MGTNSGSVRIFLLAQNRGKLQNQKRVFPSKRMNAACLHVAHGDIFGLLHCNRLPKYDTVPSATQTFNGGYCGPWELGGREEDMLRSSCNSFLVSTYV